MTVSPAADERLRATIEQINASYGDTVLFVARHRLGCTAAADAELTTIDTTGVDVMVRAAGRCARRRISFSGPVTTADEFHQQMTGVVQATRSTVGESVPLTSLERELAQRELIGSYPVSVARRTRLTPNLVEVVVTGGFDGFGVNGADDFVYVIAPRSGQLEPGYDMSRYLADCPETRPWGAYYTVRRWDHLDRHLTLWMVDHGHEAGVGAWAAGGGDQAVVWGPRQSVELPTGYRRVVVAVDETGWAAAARLAEQLPPETELRVIAEAADHDRRLDLGAPTTWVSRDGAAAGTSGALLDAIRGVEMSADDRTWFYGAGESREMAAIRRFLRHDVGYPAPSVNMIAYWRR